MSPFGISLSSQPINKLIEQLTPTDKEIQQTEIARQLFDGHLVACVNQGILPTLQSSPTMLVGSMLRQTALSPISHVDLFLQFDPSLAKVNTQDRTMTITTQHSSLSACVTPSMLVSPIKLLQTLQVIFTQQYPTTISASGQAIHIELKSHQLSLRVTPSFLATDLWWIPEERSELLWRPVSPIKEKQILDQVDETHHQFVRPTIKIMKSWNQTRNNRSWRNYHLEAMVTTHFLQQDIIVNSLIDALASFAKSLPRYLYKTPDLTDLAGPISSYLPDNIDQWYLFMNRVAELKTKIAEGEKTLVDYLLLK